MVSRYIKKETREFKDHPEFKNVKVARLISKEENERISVLVMEISPGAEAPVHSHRKEIDSIYILEGEGDAFINGKWQKVKSGDYIFIPVIEEHGVKNTGEKTLKLLAHHSPPLF